MKLIAYPVPLKFTRFPIRDKSEHFHLKMYVKAYKAYDTTKVENVFNIQRVLLLQILK